MEEKEEGNVRLVVEGLSEILMDPGILGCVESICHWA